MRRTAQRVKNNAVGRVFVFAGMLVCIFLEPQGVSASESDPQPARQVVYSPNGKYYAVSEPELGTTTVYTVNHGMTDRTQVWTLEKIFPNFHLSDDGQSFAWMPNEWNRVTLKKLTRIHIKNAVIVKFTHKNKPDAEVTLGRVMKNPKKLKPTDYPQQYLWGHAVGFNSDGLFVIDTVDRHTILINPTTGSVVLDENNNPTR